MVKQPIDYNKEIIEGLEKLKRKYELEKVRGKVMGYRKAIDSLKGVKEPITNISQVEGLPGVGDGIKRKIQEVLSTGKFREVKDPFNDDAKMKILEDFGNIWGVGTEKALRLYEAGFRSISDLRKFEAQKDKESHLSNMQKIGLKHYEDLLLKIPRDEATKIWQTVSDAANKLFPSKKLQIQACGSYRRGKSECGDVDILICCDLNSGNEYLEIQGILPKLVSQLKKQKFMFDRLGADRIAKTGSQTFMGICKVAKAFRRIDIKVYPRSQYGYAILYFTGSAQFNRNMRVKALNYGYSLSDAGIYKLSQPSHSRFVLDPKIAEGLKNLKASKVPPTEADIMKAFGMKYVKPEDRNI